MKLVGQVLVSPVAGYEKKLLSTSARLPAGPDKDRAILAAATAHGVGPDGDWFRAGNSTHRVPGGWRRGRSCISRRFVDA